MDQAIEHREPLLPAALMTWVWRAVRAPAARLGFHFGQRMNVRPYARSIAELACSEACSLSVRALPPSLLPWTARLQSWPIVSSGLLFFIDESLPGNSAGPCSSDIAKFRVKCPCSSGFFGGL